MNVKTLISKRKVSHRNRYYTIYKSKLSKGKWFNKIIRLLPIKSALNYENINTFNTSSSNPSKLQFFPLVKRK